MSDTSIGLEQWFEERKRELSLPVEEIAMADAHEWGIVEEAGRPHHIGHTSGRYHRGIFLKSFDAVRREWVERFMVAPISSSSEGQDYGIALLAKYDGRYLVQAKAEPGNGASGHVVLTTTVQASYTNIAQGLSGKIPFTDLYQDEKCVRLMVPQDGAQMYMKVNQICCLDLAILPTDIPAHFTWASAEEILALAQQGLVSEHVLQCLGLRALLP